MLHVLTVHWQSDKWIDLQLLNFQRNLGCDHRVYAFLNGVPQEHTSKYHYASTQPIVSHATKLNLLAKVAIEQSDSDNDWLLFIDGDAFPIANVAAFAERILTEFPLAAVQRLENCGDIQPHPCFSLTTVAFWKEIQGDWNEGYSWKNDKGRDVTDVGGQLLLALNQRRIAWHPMLRSNRRDLHPIWFGIYEDLVYHHGAGFRPPFSRRQIIERMTAPQNAMVAVWDLIPGLDRLRWLRKRVHPFPLLARKIAAEEEQTINYVYQQLVADPDFYRRFLE